MRTLSEAAERLGVSAATLRHQVQKGRLAARLIGKTYVVTEREIERYRATSLGKPWVGHISFQNRRSSSLARKVSGLVSNQL